MKDDNLSETLNTIGVSRTEAARAIGISRQYLHALERGEQEPTRPVILRTLAFLNQPSHLKRLGRRRPVTFEELFGDSARPGRAA